MTDEEHNRRRYNEVLRERVAGVAPPKGSGLVVHEGWTVVNEDGSAVLRLGWRLGRESIWIPRDVAEFNTAGGEHSVVRYEVEDNARDAAHAVGGKVMELRL